MIISHLFTRKPGNSDLCVNPLLNQLLETNGIDNVIESCNNSKVSFNRCVLRLAEAEREAVLNLYPQDTLRKCITGLQQDNINTPGTSHIFFNLLKYLHGNQTDFLQSIIDDILEYVWEDNGCYGFLEKNGYINEPETGDHAVTPAAQLLAEDGHGDIEVGMTGDHTVLTLDGIPE